MKFISHVDFVFLIVPGNPLYIVMNNRSMAGQTESDLTSCVTCGPCAFKKLELRDAFRLLSGLPHRARSCLFRALRAPVAPRIRTQSIAKFNKSENM